ncbi:MAG: single-stranded DNA-binding protein [Oscillospiraceae bacterium]|jgi:hypothetical protein|nr:single-stranded DNA-binding protein [Oscillospiraceae bacterium]
MNTITTIDLSNSRLSVPELLEYAKGELPKLYSGETFILSALFVGYEWLRIPLKDRRLLGRFFLDFATSEEGRGMLEIVEVINQGKQRYMCK